MEKDSSYFSKPKIIKKAIQFLEEYEPYFECPVEKQDKNGDVTTRMERIANPPPNIRILAKALGLSKSTLHRYLKNKKSWDTVKELMDLTYSETLQENAIMNMYSGSFAIFAAKNRLGWKDKSEVSGENGQPIEIAFKIIENDKL